MSRDSAVSAIERGNLSELQHILEKSEWDIGSEPLESIGQTALHIACANGHLDIVQYLVNKKGCSVIVKDVYGQTPLILSFINKHWKVANFLLLIAPKSEINELAGVLGSYNKSIVMEIATKEALVASYKEGYFELVKYIIESGWHTVGHEETQLARFSGNMNIVKYLLTHCQCTMPDDMSEVHIACIQGDVENVKIALESNGPSIFGTPDSFGTAPIHYTTLEPNILKMVVQYAGEILLNITDSMGNTPLHHSIKYECIESVTILVGAPGCDVNLANLKGETPLIAACKYSNSDIVQVLVASERCDINTSDNKRNTALHIAVSSDSSGRLESVQCLLQSDKCDPNVINKSGYTPLHIACHRDFIPVLEALVADKRCDMNIRDGNGDTALHIWVKSVKVVKCLLESGRSRCDIYNEKGLTPFHKAIANGVMASVEVMMKNGVNILQTTNDKFQNAPIHIACVYYRRDILKYFLCHTNCDPNQQNAEGDTALHIVCRMRTGSELQFFELLTFIGINSTLVNHEGIAPCDVVGNDGNTLLHIACAEGNIVIVELLLNNGADILKPDRNGDAPIHIASRFGRLSILKILLGCTKSDPNQQNSKGATALHIVCRKRTGRELQFLELLTSTPGINPTIVNHEGIIPFEVVGNDGNTLLHNACAEGNAALVEFLMKKGVDIQKSNEQGDAPIHIACKWFQLNSLKAILGSKDCDPNQQNAEGNTALHIVCRKRTGCELEFLELLTSTPGINPTIVNHEGIIPFEVVGNDSNTLLHNACAEGNTALVEFLMKEGVDIQKSNGQGDAPIHIACKWFQLNSLKSILDSKDCDPNQQNAEGNTALHIVCRKRTGCELEFLELLTSAQGINPTIVNHGGNTLLHNACAEGNAALVEFLMKKGVDIQKSNGQGDAPIHIACKCFQLNSLKDILDSKDCDPNQQNAEGNTALHIVCRKRTGCELEFLELLTSTPGINPTIVNHEGIIPFEVVGNDGNTLLHNACAEGNATLVEFLMKKGVDIQKSNGQGDAPIHIACKWFQLNSLKAILDSKDCDPNQQNAEGNTALHIVCRKRTGCELEFLELLTSTPGINPTIINHEGDAPIHIACKWFQLNSLKAILDSKDCDPNQQNAEGNTALHIVCRKRTGCELEFLELLTSTTGINPTIVNHEGDAPIHIACINFKLQSLIVLLSCKSCDPNQRNTRGDTALHIVCRMRTGDVLQIFELLTSTPGINPTLVNTEGIAPCDEVGDDGNTLLHIACAEENSKTVEFLVKNGVDVLKPDRHGDAPIHITCKHSRLDVLRVLLACTNCDPNQLNAEGDTALHIVCRMRTGNELQFLELQCLLQSDRCDPNAINKSGHTPLHIVCYRGEISLLEVLVADKRCDLNIQDGNGDTALHIGVDNVEVVKCLLESGRSRCDIYNEKGLTPFHKAIVNGFMASVEVMLKNGVNILKNSNDEFQNASIHIACVYYRRDILKFFLCHTNCDPNQQNAVGDTALHIVCKTGRNLELQCILQSDRCDPNVINKSGSTPLHIVCHRGVVPLLKALVADKRCDLNIQDGNGDTALHIGVENVEVVKCLLESGRIRCDIYNEEGLTPFHKAIANGVMTSVEVMLKNGVNILQTTNDDIQNAPIHIACIYSRLNILKFLLRSTNCNPTQQNVVGNTALHIVCRMRTGRELEFLELLTSTPGINPTIVNNEGIVPFEVVGNDGNTLLHNTCAEGSTVIVELLLNNGADILKPDRNGDAPIHIACRFSRLSTLKVLLGCTNCDPNQQNAEGDTALHIVCRKRTGRELQFLELLTSTPGINPTIVNHEGIAPSEVVDRDGNTLLHNACVEGNIRVAELLLKYDADVLKLNRYGDAPIHVACKHSRLEVLKGLFTSSNCNPDQLNADGDTALHIVSRKRGSSEVITKIVEFLVKNGADLLKSDRHGEALIHVACKHSRLDVLKILLGCRDYNPNQQNGSGDTAMHIVCRNSEGSKLPFLKMLLSTPGINPEIVNHEGRIPIEVAGTNYFYIIKKFLEHKKSSIQAYLKIFVVGNSGTGKSTLIKAVTTEASQLLKFAPLSKMKYVNPSDVPPYTAGIVPTPFNSKHFGNAVLYDFAGQHEYYSSHAAVMENLILPSPPLFLLLIDISKSKEEIREELVYWWHFINNQSQKAAAPPHVILAGSHKDMVKSSEREELETMLRECIKRVTVTFKFVGYFPLDCRKLVSRDLSALLNELNTTCQTLRQIVDANLHCHILNALLRAPEFQDAGYCEAIHVIKRIESDDALLPKNVSQLISLLASLNDQGHILLLKNHTDESKSWVILKPNVLLTEVNGRIFAPKYFKGHSEFAISTISCKSTGVVTLSKLKEKFTEYNHEVIVAYMTHLEFCFRIKDKHILAMITKYAVYESAATEEYYFFPALVSVENPTDVCQPHQSIDYECGWLYKCSKETEQLTTRFLHVLILRLAFACDPPDDPTETESVVLLRKCSVWKHGIAWWTNDGIEVIVEVGLQCRWVAVMLRCPNDKKVECAELRSKVIHTVLKVKTDFCPAIAMTEYLIAPSSLKYPFEGRELTLYHMREATAATIEGKDYARDTEGKNPITIPQLLPFEPYHNMGDLVPKFFSGDTSVPVTPEELMQLAEKCHDKLPELKTAFKPDIGSFQRKCAKADCTEVERCVALFHILQRRGRFKTWRDFQQEFNRFSVFCEQSPLVRITIFPRIVRGNILFVYVEKSWKIF